MECLTFDQLIYQYRYNVLEQEQWEKMNQHLKNCKKCQKLVNRSDKTIDLLGEWKVDLVKSNLVKKTLQKIPPVTIHYAKIRWAGLAAAAMLFVFLTIVLAPEKHDAPSLSEAQKQQEHPSLYHKKSTVVKDTQPTMAPVKTAARKRLGKKAIKEAMEMDDENKLQPVGELDNISTKPKISADNFSDEEKGNKSNDVPSALPREEKMSAAYAYFLNEYKKQEKKLRDNASSTTRRFSKTPLPIVSQKKEKSERQNTGQFMEGKSIQAEQPIFIQKTDEIEVPINSVGEKNNKKEKKHTSNAKRALVWEHPFVSPKQYPISKFSLNVGDTSYQNCRQLIYQGVLPPRENVRIEEFINHFRYEYPFPQGKKNFSITAELGACPWTPHNLLLHIGIQGKQSKLKFIAKDVQAQVKFNPEDVKAYRLIGFENHEKENRINMQITSGQELTVIYEIIPEKVKKTVKLACKTASSRKTTLGKIMLLRYIQPASKIDSLVSIPIYKDSLYSPFPSRNFNWSAAVAGFAMLLRDSRYKGGLSYDLVMELGQGAIGNDLQGQRDKFLEMVIMAKILSKK